MKHTRLLLVSKIILGWILLISLIDTDTSTNFAIVRASERVPLRQPSLSALQGNSANIVALVVNPNGTMLASAGSDGVIRLWNALTQQLVMTLTGHTGEVSGIAFEPTSSVLI